MITSDQHRKHNFNYDLIRGVAALSVVFYHSSTRINVPSFFHHGYLAVDLFFGLSGAVISIAYSDRLRDNQLSAERFVRLRLVRLLPLLILGSLIGAATEIFRPGIGLSLEHLEEVGFALGLNILLIPYFGHGTFEWVVFPLNGPIWSLFFEILSNFAFIPIMRSAKGVSISIIIMLISIGPLICTSVPLNGILVGPGPDTFFGGIARVFFSFSLGYVIARLRRRVVYRIPVSIVLLIISFIFATPELVRLHNIIFDVVCIVIVFPCCILYVSENQGHVIRHRFATWFGNMSYPLYAIHYPILKVGYTFLMKLHVGVSVRVASAIGFSMILAILSAVVFKFYDQPVRVWLTARSNRSMRHSRHLRTSMTS